MYSWCKTLSIVVYNVYCIYLNLISIIVVPIELEKMRAELANLNHCAVPFLNRAAVNLSWYDNHPTSEHRLKQQRWWFQR